MHSVSWNHARALLYRDGQALPLPTEWVPLGQAIGRVLAEPVRTVLPVPHYDSSAMDGFAVSGPPPWQILWPAPAEPGENIHRQVSPLLPGQARPILTGGLLPPGADAVLRQEEALVTSHRLSPRSGAFSPERPYPVAGADIRRAGEELPAGSQVAQAGTLLSARHIGALGVLGLDWLTLYQQPRIAIAYTGNEVITSGLPQPGQVRDAFSLQFPQILADFGARCVSTTRLVDTQEDFFTWLTTAEADLLLLTGGSSTSSADWLRRTLAEMDANYLFESVSVRPGHPALAARLPHTANPAAPLVLGLPGNPLAAHTALYSYLPAWVAGCYGQDLQELPLGTLADAIPGYRKAELRLLPVTLDTRANGHVLTPLAKTRSHMLTSFAYAQALALIPAQGAEAGYQVPYLPLVSAH
ncbi:molybdopterin molybdotransferase MoeA [Rothia sp. P5766]|uniref:molybdopterin molybdotransferase MoeA n=1 Tax=Rothia sp. P5766 TaxID=3402656 RepID=UPI003AD9ACFB